MNDQNLTVLTNIIGAVETGGQIYGHRYYASYVGPGANTPGEVTVTLGAYGFYGERARELVIRILSDLGKSAGIVDSSVIGEILAKNWETASVSPTEAQADCLTMIIDSAVGHEVQDAILREQLTGYIDDCTADFPAAGIPAQMMYCEIRHLGGKSAANRICKRATDFSLDGIIASLKLDQDDTASDYQVGDVIFWSRHEKCKEFISRYAVREEDYMGVIIGSARIDERGKASGGAAGDQKQTTQPDYSGEVSMQSWYLHSKGWTVIRAKDASIRERIARDMEYACNNANIGYDQSQNNTLYDIVKNLDYDCSRVAKKCETDCARLVRVCVLYAGVDTDDFYTGSEIAVLKATGAFDVLTDSKYCKSSDYLMRGDILCTNTKGHTVVVLSDGAKIESETAASGAVCAYQQFLNKYYPDFVKKACGELLDVDGSYGELTRAASVAVWKYMANKYYSASLTVGNKNFLAACKTVAAKMTLYSITDHVTLVKILQGALAGLGYYNDEIDGSAGPLTVAAIKALQGAKGLAASGELTGETWYMLFN